MIAPGAHAIAGGMRFAVSAGGSERVELCLFDGDRETRAAMARGSDGLHVAEVAGAGAGTRYGYRAHGPWAPEQGLRFDAAKLLVDPFAVLIDRPFAHDPRLAERGTDTAALVPKSLVPPDLPPLAPAPPLFRPGGLIYELNVRGLTMLHPAVPEHQRGTIAALAHPAVIGHLRSLHVAAVELMPIVAWIDERHLPPLGLRNAWGYNPVVPMALDPRLAPGGLMELRDTVAALRAAGIGTILDLVLNHSGESDALGPTLSLRGLDNRLYYAHAADDPGRLVNHTGCGNMLACWRPEVGALVLETLRHFVRAAGVDGFRFDLAPVLGRGPDGFDPAAPLLAAIAADPLLRDRILIAEPWDIGPGGYQLGRFPAGWLEWNDRYRDDVRRFWRGDPHMLGALATRLAGSSDVFGHGEARATRSVSFLAAHDGFTLADTVAYAERHNEANGEHNRDGHGENFSWNRGVEGPIDDPAILAARDADLRALLTTLFATRGTILLCAGDEFGRTQQGNNNAYAQDNAIGWIDWAGRDTALEAFVVQLAEARASCPMLAGASFLHHDEEIASIEWSDPDGGPIDAAAWHGADAVGLRLTIVGRDGRRLVVRLARRSGCTPSAAELSCG